MSIGDLNSVVGGMTKRTWTLGPENNSVWSETEVKPLRNFPPASDPFPPWTTLWSGLQVDSVYLLAFLSLLSVELSVEKKAQQNNGR